MKPITSLLHSGSVDLMNFKQWKDDHTIKTFLQALQGSFINELKWINLLWMDFTVVSLKASSMTSYHMKLHKTVWKSLCWLHKYLHISNKRFSHKLTWKSFNSQDYV